MDAARRVRGRLVGIKGWQVWQLPRWLAVFVVAVMLVDVVITAFAPSHISVRLHDLELLAALLACSAATIELTRRLGEKAGIAKDVYIVWELPVAILLPVVYVPIIPIVRFTLAQLRVRRIPLHRRAFSAAAIGISLVAAALTFHAIMRLAPGLAANPARHAMLW